MYTLLYSTGLNLEVHLVHQYSLSAQGYDAGYIHGCKEGLLEGYATGQTKGAQIGSEVS